ncbi:hypothetical protein [Micavibrio aeruginosavorus]|uniref:hypothetical protein n=1 Tax=Micavibrio aeruginosavorus TaxID=349221 RepID=UPI003F4AA6EC
MKNIKLYVLGTVLVSALSVPVAVRAEEIAGDAANDAMKRPPAGERMMEALDTDKSGDVSLEEFQAKHAEQFKTMDANSDGKLTKDEIGKAHDARKAKMQERMQEKREQMKDKAAKDAAPAEEAPKAE